MATTVKTYTERSHQSANFPSIRRIEASSILVHTIPSALHTLHKESKRDTHHLSLPATLHQRSPLPILPHRIGIIGSPARQAGQTQKPKHYTNRQRYSSFKGRGLVLEMKGYHNGYRDDSHIDRETEPGEECTLVGTVVTGIGGIVVEEEGR